MKPRVLPQQGGPGHAPHLAASWEGSGKEFTFKLRDDVKFVSVQIDPHDAHKHGAHPLIGDARIVLGQLADALAEHRVSDEWAASVRSARGR